MWSSRCVADDAGPCCSSLCQWGLFVDGCGGALSGWRQIKMLRSSHDKENKLKATSVINEQHSSVSDRLPALSLQLKFA